MDKLVTISTRVRPIKKLFIIEPDDILKLIKIIELISSEINGYSNLILVNDKDLRNENTLNFINWHDPDIIVNCSNCSDDLIEEAFKIKIIDYSYINQISTPLMMFDNLPDFVKLLWKGEGFVHANFNSEINENDLLKIVNFGLIKEDLRQNLKNTIFKNIEIKDIESVDNEKNFINILKDQKENFLFISESLSLTSIGDSVWSENHNPNDYFKDPTIVIGNYNDLKSIAYFWNMRATYPLSGIMWLPYELFSIYQNHLCEYKKICLFGNEEIRNQIINKNHCFIQIDSSKYYFKGLIDEWRAFEHHQNISIIENKAMITHPENKFFSSNGFNLSFILEIRGFDEVLLPKSNSLGNLFINPNFKLLPYDFARISQKGLAIFSNNFEPFISSPLIEEIDLPDERKIFEAFFLEHDFNLRETKGVRIVEQLINLLGGYKQLEIIANITVFELLIKLTPKRIERIVKLVTSKLNNNISEDEIREQIINNIGMITTISSNIIVDLLKMNSLLGIKKDKRDFYDYVQRLYNRKILLRGKSFDCPSCHSRLWFPLESIEQENRCYCCNQVVNIPVYQGNEISSDSFRLNELMVNAVDQGVLPLLLVINYLSKQSFKVKRFLSNYEIINKSNGKLVAEIDLIFTLSRRIGLGEIKADRGFESSQIDRLIQVAKILSVDMLLFATLKDKTSTEVVDLVNYLKDASLNIPAFIICKDLLFDKSPKMIDKYFEAHLNRFPKGPILL